MTEKEYIEREATIEKLNRLCDRVCQYSKAQRKYMCGACPLGDAFTVIEDDLPAADVAPVRHGRWETVMLDHERMGCRPTAHYCSDCHQITWFRTFYCPNCGADMREES